MSGPFQPSNGRTKLILLATLFAAPVIFSTLLYTVGWRPERIVNYGELVQPPRPLPEIGVHDIDRNAVELRKKWTMVYFAPTACAETCRQNLYKMRQVHAAQGRESNRIQRVVIVDADRAHWLVSVRAEYPDLRIVEAAQENIKIMAQAFMIVDGPLDRLNRIYVVDPRGNFMLSYLPDTDAGRMRKDLERLLKVSQIG